MMWGTDPRVPVPQLAGAQTPNAITTPPNLQQVPVQGGGFLAALQNPEIQKLLAGIAQPQQGPQFAMPQIPQIPRHQWAPPIQAAPIAPFPSMFG